MNRDTFVDLAPDLFEALAEAAGDMKAIEKGERNQQQNFMFRSIEAIVAASKPVLSGHGISITPIGTYTTAEEVQSGKGARGWRTVATITYRIGHKSGQSIVAEMVGEAIDYGDKSTTKAAQMAYKYLLTQLLGIGSEDPDAESPEAVAQPPRESGRPTPAEPKKELTEVEQRVLAVKQSIYQQSGNDAEAAKAVWEGLLEGLGIKPDAKIGAKRVEKIEAAWLNGDDTGMGYE